MVYMFTFNDSNIPADSFCNTVLDDDCAKEMPLHTMKQPAHHFNMNVITLYKHALISCKNCDSAYRLMSPVLSAFLAMPSLHALS